MEVSQPVLPVLPVLLGCALAHLGATRVCKSRHTQRSRGCHASMLPVPALCPCCRRGILFHCRHCAYRKPSAVR